jgi:hypothetical protein
VWTGIRGPWTADSQFGMMAIISRPRDWRSVGNHEGARTGGHEADRLGCPKGAQAFFFWRTFRAG